VATQAGAAAGGSSRCRHPDPREAVAAAFLVPGGGRSGRQASPGMTLPECTPRQVAGHPPVVVGRGWRRSQNRHGSEVSHGRCEKQNVNGR